MSIRINKVLGYGLLIEPNDSRLDIERSFDFDLFINYVKQLTEEAADAFSQLDYRILLASLESNRSAAPRIAINTDEALIIVPPEYCDKWSRHDDDIDYYESKGLSEDTYKFLTTPIYPFVGRIDSRNGNKLPEHIITNIIAIINYLQQEKGLDEQQKYLDHLNDKGYHATLLTSDDHQWREFGKFLTTITLDSLDHFKQIVAPAIPTSVQLYCEFAQVFKDQQTIFQLRPMIATYWR
jgi:hypothetical protein